MLSMKMEQVGLGSATATVGAVGGEEREESRDRLMPRRLITRRRREGGAGWRYGEEEQLYLATLREQHYSTSSMRTVLPAVQLFVIP